MRKIIKAAEQFALEEIKRHGLPSLVNFTTANEKGNELAKKFNVNADIVAIGTRLMDIKLGEAQKTGGDHIELGVAATKTFLKRYAIDPKNILKIVNCVEAHHRTVHWICKEAELVANADCYRFLLPRNWLLFLHSLGTRGMDFQKSLDYGVSKVDEKWKILSLPYCKKELTTDYKLIKEIIKKARQ